MGLRDLGASLPPGFRFYPNDEELVLHYLYKKIKNEQVLKDTLVEIDLHTCEPWQLPGIYIIIPCLISLSLTVSLNLCFVLQYDFFYFAQKVSHFFFVSFVIKRMIDQEDHND